MCGYFDIMAIAKSFGNAAVKIDAFRFSLLSSVAIHVGIVAIVSVVLRNRQLHRQDLLPIDLIEISHSEDSARSGKINAAREIEKSRAFPKVEKLQGTKQQAKILPSKPDRPVPVIEEPTKLTETIPAAPTKADNPPNSASAARAEGGGSEAGTGNLFGKSDVAVVPGAGVAGGGGTAASGLGRGSGAPGLPAQAAPLKMNREAKPIQTVRAVYPPMALRSGFESDVILRIEVDAEGKVTKAEITKSGGAGFDQEALKAVKQSRFEPAQRDGQLTPAEFTYIYRFRLQR